MTAETPPGPTLRIALGEYDIGWQDPDRSLDLATVRVERAAAAGARLVVLPEMCTTGFTMDTENWAEDLGGPSFTRLSTIAAVNEVWLLAGVAMRTQFGFENVAAMFTPVGSLVATYAKQRLFTFGNEHKHYLPGETPVVIDVDGVRVSPFICYDLRFPELFRAAARFSDVLVVMANWPAARREHWDVLLRARAIENLSYVVGVNRTGVGRDIVYDGGSAAYDPWGAPVAARVAADAPMVVDVSTDHVRDIRAKYPFLDDLMGPKA